MKFKKGDIIAASDTHPCIVIGRRQSSHEVYNVYVVDSTYLYNLGYLYCQWDIDKDAEFRGIPRKIGRIHPEFIDLFL